MTESKRHRMIRLLLADDPDRCECGTLLSEHLPLPSPPPLTGWRSTRGKSGLPPGLHNPMRTWNLAITRWRPDA